MTAFDYFMSAKRIPFPSLPDQFATRSRQDAEQMDETRQTADGRGAATESKQEDLVVFFEVLEDELVTLPDVLGKVASHDVSGRFSPSGAQPWVVERDLSLGAFENEIEELETLVLSRVPPSCPVPSEKTTMFLGMFSPFTPAADHTRDGDNEAVQYSYPASALLASKDDPGAAGI